MTVSHRIISSTFDTVLSRYSGHTNARPNRSLYLEFIIPRSALFKICVINAAPSDAK
jgi:hypothetical protein